ncbi:oxygen-independent coproporphyrinogen III oxidase [Ignatzschineria cameli]|uniref:Coproporphyrinogen-III oxidase n=1 Tax=Ignatzschineria cameli TaxID=2182793 RepID=A0ABX5KYX0_9GAMM|nr:oxygen-independent coproporphyrinogen III oxidase [Ignatzschineria cameli]PWD88979.1 oxygen-independent coproporphyrinogen III oxidase [Ignatzschineria cameli]PWD90141.1 oxygen-independent coproporphyrinogen III oxidase [Ignatzschineria cameli]PWD90804.1 oxygen-independent coproporphyrinogen III oxidase [Ignatzschineria cameli]
MTNKIFNEALIAKYDKAGPRYTSYPTAVQFTEEFGSKEYQQAAAESNARKNPLSLYFHIPFCATICFYCGCNKIITNNRKRSQPYLERLFKEMEMQGELFSNRAPVKQLHWGGGTPTFLSHDEMRSLMEKTREEFNLLSDDEAEISIEVDPREADADTVHFLRSIGFNRLSMGVQDFDEKVQVAVNRIQPKEITIETLTAARESGFNSISLDLIYGLPFQTVDSFNRTLEEVIELSPDRLSVFNYAHMPHLFKTQKQMNPEDMPSPQEKLLILKQVIERLTDAGYVYIGMDHFAKPTDQLAIAQKEGLLYRNFQGYSTHSDCDLIGMGISSISQIGDIYAQNAKIMPQYEAMIDRGELPIMRGVKLTKDDLIRRHVITEIMCNLKLDLDKVSEDLGIDAREYFKADLPELDAMQDDGLIVIENDRYYVQDAGRLLIRNIGMVFDAYLRKNDNRFSRVI